MLLCPAALTQQRVKMNSEHRGLPIVKCVIAGKPMHCLIDSGSDITFVPPSAQFKTSARKFTIKTSTGVTQLPEADVTVQIGSADVTVVALVQKLATVMPFDAILGENFLRAFKQVSFDYAHSAILLGTARQAIPPLRSAIIP